MELKENIRRVGDYDNNLGWYEWDWNDKAKEIGVEVGDAPGIRVTVGFTIRVEIGVGDSLVSLSLESSTIEYPTISSPKNNRLIEINTTTMSIIPAIYLINYQLKLLIKLSRCNITSFGFSSRHQCPPLES